MADFKIKIDPANGGDQFKLTVHCVRGGPIVSNPTAKAFHLPGVPPHVEKVLEKHEEGEEYSVTFDDPYDETTFVEVFALFEGGQAVTKGHPLSAENEVCDPTA